MTTVYALNDSKMLLVNEESGSKIRYDRSNQLAQQVRKDKPLTSKQKKSVELLCAGLSPLCVADGQVRRPKGAANRAKLAF